MLLFLFPRSGKCREIKSHYPPAGVTLLGSYGRKMTTERGTSKSGPTDRPTKRVCGAVGGRGMDLLYLLPWNFPLHLRKVVPFFLLPCCAPINKKLLHTFVPSTDMLVNHYSKAHLYWLLNFIHEMMVLATLSQFVLFKNVVHNLKRHSIN